MFCSVGIPDKGIFGVYSTGFEGIIRVYTQCERVFSDEGIFRVYGTGYFLGIIYPFYTHFIPEKYPVSNEGI